MYGKIRTQGSLIETKEEKVYRIRKIIAEGEFSRIIKAEEHIGEDSQIVLLKEYLAAKYEETGLSAEEAADREFRQCRRIAESGFSGALTINYRVHELESGIVFGVMTDVRKGETLQNFVNSTEWNHMVLCDRLQLGYELCRLLADFHQETEIIHGDLSPSNIYLYHTGIDYGIDKAFSLALLDFGCSVCIENEEEAVFIGGTEGYVHPELESGIRSSMGKGDDWYAAVQVFWYLLTGYSPITYPVTANHLKDIYEKIAVNYEADYLSDADSGSVIENYNEGYYDLVLDKLNDIFLNQQEYNADMVLSIKKIIDVIKNVGISRERLCVLLKESYMEMHQQRFANQDIIRRILPHVGFETRKGRARFVDSGNMKAVQLKEFIQISQSSLFMIGDGGVGKTTSLIDILNQFYEKNTLHLRNPLVFIELCVLSQNDEEWYSEEMEGTFIEQFIASYFCGNTGKFADKNHPYVKALREDMFRQAEGGRRAYTILLDGLNEVGFANTDSRTHFLDALNHYLLYAKNVRLIITGRNDVHELSSDHLKRLKTVGLDDNNISEMLLDAVSEKRLSRAEYDRLVQNKEDISSREYRLWNCLKIPFFLIMYCFVSERQGITRQGEILKRFFHDKRETLDDAVTYGEKVQSQTKYMKKSYSLDTKLRMDLSIRVLLDFIIPEMAIEMTSTNHFYITWERLTAFLEDTLKRFQSGKCVRWMKTYYGYEVDVREIFAKIYEIDKGNRIAGYACDVLGIMRMTADKALFFTHQYFRDYFAACAVKNRMLHALECQEEHPLYADSEEFRAMVYPLHDKELTAYVCSFTGELLGEHHNMPYFDSSERKWRVPLAKEEEQAVLGRFLNLYRFLWKKGGNPQALPVHIGLKNVIEILKHSRIQNTGKTDFAGLAFDGLFLQGISLYGINFSHYNSGEGETVCATFADARYVQEALERKEEQEFSVCCAIHPSERKILLLNQRTNVLAELNLDSGERRTLGEPILFLEYAEYIAENGDLFLLSSEPKSVITGTNNREPARRQAIILRYEEEKQRRRNMLTTLWCYRHSDEKRFPLLQADGEILKVVKMDTQNRFGVCLKNTSAGEVNLLIVNLKAENISPIEEEGSKPEESIVEGRYTLPEKQLFRDASNRNFWFSYAGKDEFLIGDVKQCSGSVGIWNTAAGTLRTALFMHEPDDSDSIQAMAKCEKNGNVYLVVRHGKKRAGVRNYSYASLAQYKPEDSNEWENTFIQSGKLKELNLSEGTRIEMLPDHSAFIALYDGQCMKIDVESKETLWTVNATARNFHLRNGMMILEASEGIYEVDIATGYSVCIQNHKEEKNDLIIGNTNLSEKIVSFDGKQIVKWIDVNTGAAYRHTILQDTGKEYEKIYGDGNQERILAISGRTITCWDALSGLVIDSQIIPLPRQLKLSNIDFDKTGYQLLIYYNGVDYNFFPAEKYLALENWKLYQDSGERENRQIERLKQQIHYIVSDNGCIVEEPGNQPPILRIKEETQPVSFVDKILKLLEFSDEDEDLDYEDWDDEFSGEKRKVEWHQDVDFAGYEFKRISILKENDKKLYVDTIHAEDRVIGCVGKTVLSSYEKDFDSEVLKLSRRNYCEAVELKALHGSYVQNAFIVGKVAVFQQKKNISNQINLLFWDMRGADVYQYEPKDYLLCTGCAIGEKRGDGLEKKAKLSSQLPVVVNKADERNKNVVDKAKRFPLQGTYVLKNLKERWKAVNFPALFVVLVLTALSYSMFFILEQKFGVQQWKQLLVTGGIYFIAFSIAMPYVTDFLETGKTMVWFDIILFGIALLLIIKCRKIDDFEWYSISRSYFNRWMWILYPCYIVALQKDVKHKKLCVLHVFSMFFIGCRFFRTDCISDTVFINYLLLVYATWLYMASMKHHRFEVKKAVKLLILSGAVLGGSLGVLWMVYQRVIDRKSLRWMMFEDSLAIWNGYIQRNREVLKSAKLIGEGSVPQITEANWEYFRYYLINFIFGKYGIIAGVSVIGVFLLLLYWLYKGAKYQRIPIDRHICFGCSFFITIQFVIYLFPNLGLQLIPPNAAPFLNIGIPSFYSSWMALLIYQIYYRAHRNR